MLTWQLCVYSIYFWEYYIIILWSSYISFPAIGSHLSLPIVSEFFTIWVPSFKAIAASDLWFDISSEFSRPEAFDGNFVLLLLSVKLLDGFGDVTNNGFAAGSMFWSKALKLAHPESFVAVVAFDSKEYLHPFKIHVAELKLAIFRFVV